jgi:hypothetical protein
LAAAGPLALTLKAMVVAHQGLASLPLVLVEAAAVEALVVEKDPLVVLVVVLVLVTTLWSNLVDHRFLIKGTTEDLTDQQIGPVAVAVLALPVAMEHQAKPETAALVLLTPTQAPASLAQAVEAAALTTQAERQARVALAAAVTAAVVQQREQPIPAAVAVVETSALTALTAAAVL